MFQRSLLLPQMTPCKDPHETRLRAEQSTLHNAAGATAPRPALPHSCAEPSTSRSFPGLTKCLSRLTPRLCCSLLSLAPLRALPLQRPPDSSCQPPPATPLAQGVPRLCQPASVNPLAGCPDMAPPAQVGMRAGDHYESNVISPTGLLPLAPPASKNMSPSHATASALGSRRARAAPRPMHAN